MPFPDSPCASCPRPPGSGPCLAMEVRNPRYCAHAAAGHTGYIALLAGDRPPPPAATRAFPPLAEQAGNLAGAVGRFVASGGEMASQGERARRQAICAACPEFADGRCRRCGCRLSLKQAMSTEHCPLDPPKW